MPVANSPLDLTIYRNLCLVYLGNLFIYYFIILLYQQNKKWFSYYFMKWHGHNLSKRGIFALNQGYMAMLWAYGHICFYKWKIVCVVWSIVPSRSSFSLLSFKVSQLVKKGLCRFHMMQFWVNDSQFLFQH